MIANRESAITSKKAGIGSKPEIKEFFNFLIADLNVSLVYTLLKFAAIEHCNENADVEAVLSIKDWLEKDCRAISSGISLSFFDFKKNQNILGVTVFMGNSQYIPTKIQSRTCFQLTMDFWFKKKNYLFKCAFILKKKTKHKKLIKHANNKHSKKISKVNNESIKF